MLLNWEYQHSLDKIFGKPVCFSSKIYQQIKISHELIAAYNEAVFLQILLISLQMKGW